VADLLIVDDDTDTAEALARLLRADGHAVRCTADAGGALRQLTEQPPDLVLLDLGLPRVFGLDLLDAVRDDGRFAAVPVAVYTGRDDPALRATAERLGASGFIVKGRSWAATREEIRHCLARAGDVATHRPQAGVASLSRGDAAVAHRAFAG
jgi:DNA-binding response OmpR family regulator